VQVRYTPPMRSSLPSTPDTIAQSLRLEIHSGALEPGLALRQEDLAQRFGTSRIPVRDALKTLEGEGLVRIYPAQGAFVSRPRASEVLELFEIRILLELELLRQAWPNFDAAQMLKVEQTLQPMRTAPDLETWNALDFELHRSLYMPAGKLRMLEQVENLRGQTNRFCLLTHPDKLELEHCDGQHAALIAACKNGDLETALERLKSHLEHASGVMYAHLRGQETSR